GRYPWVVYGLQTMEDGVSVVTDPVSLLISLIGFVAVYTILAIADVYLIKRHGIKNPESDQEITSSIEGKGASLWT
ncbi:MAG: cytochrome ubiquinol oxidase subunit I, partial [Lachnospiraceae bacterium]|nr:cytochrome ubiquinol oxidase subunit I [Lachnospiraceae bacterium]